MKAAFVSQLEVIRLTQQNVSNNPYKPYHVHQFRVALRTMRGMFNFIKPLLAEDTYEVLNGRLRDSAKELSLLRELDVFIEMCEKIAEEQPDLDDYLALFAWLHNKRAIEMNRVMAWSIQVQFREGSRLVEDFISTSAVFDAYPSYFITKRIEKKTDLLEEAYQKLDVSDYEKMHELRKQAKKLRYATAAFGDLTKLKTKAINQKATEIQEKLGTLTDQAVNRGLLQHFASETDDLALRNLLGKINEHPSFQ